MTGGKARPGRRDWPWEYLLATTVRTLAASVIFGMTSATAQSADSIQSNPDPGPGLAARAGKETQDMAGTSKESGEARPIEVPDAVDLATPAKTALMGKAKRWQVENVPQAIALRAMMNVMGEDLGRQDDDTGAGDWRTDWTYPMALAVMGESFRWCWPLEPTVIPAVEPLEGRATRYQWALQVVGLRADVLGQETDADVLRARVTHCLAVEGWPVLIEGLPEPGHVTLVTGYSSGGSVLHGWSAEGGGPSILFEPELRTEFRDWESRLTLVLVPTGRSARQEPKDAYTAAIRRGASEVRRQRWLGRDCGPAMYDAWTEAILDDSLDAEDEATVQRRRLILDPPIWDLAERRHYAALFLRRGAELLNRPLLHRAADEFRAIHDLMYDILHIGGGEWPGNDMPKLNDPDVRERIAELIFQAGGHDARAADLIEEAMAD